MIDKILSHIEYRNTKPGVSLRRVRRIGSGISLRIDHNYILFYFKELINSLECIHSTKDVKCRYDLYLGDPDLLNKINMLVDEFQSQC